MCLFSSCSRSFLFTFFKFWIFTFNISPRYFVFNFLLSMLIHWFFVCLLFPFAFFSSLCLTFLTFRFRHFAFCFCFLKIFGYYGLLLHLLGFTFCFHLFFLAFFKFWIFASTFCFQYFAFHAYSLVICLFTLTFHLFFFTFLHFWILAFDSSPLLSIFSFQRFLDVSWHFAFDISLSTFCFWHFAFDILVTMLMHWLLTCLLYAFARFSSLFLFFFEFLLSTFYSIFRFQHFAFNISLSTFCFRHFAFDILLSTFCFQHFAFDISLLTSTSSDVTQ